MKKLCNVRVPVLLACAVASGVGLGYLFVFYNIDLFWLITVVPPTAILFAVFAIKTKRATAPVIVVLIALTFLLGALNCVSRLNSYEDDYIEDGNQYAVCATVLEKGVNDYGEYLILKNLSFDGVARGGKCYVYLSETYGDFCDVGYDVRFTSAISSYDLFPYGKLNYNAAENIRYSCIVSGGLTATYKFSLFGYIRNSVSDTLYDNLDSGTAAVVLAMLTGNTQNVDSATLQTFRYGGMAHIFAVSGLHIGLIYAILSFICKKLKLNKYLTALICCGFVFFYAGVCGFTLSSVRAAVMCTVAALTRLLHRKYDGLNALSFAVLIMLMISPLSLFTVGFQLSVCAVAGIFLLSGKLKRLLRKLPSKLSSAISISLSAQAGTLPVLLANFGYLSGAGLLLNIVLIPVLSVLYVIAFTVTLFCMLTGAPIILTYAVLPLEAVLSFLQNAGFEKALISGFGAGAFIPIYYFGLFALSDKFNLKFIYKAAAVTCAAVMLITYVLVRIYAPFNGYRIVVSAYYGGGNVIISSGGNNVLIVTQDMNSSRLYSELGEYYASGVDAVIILGGEDCVLSFSELGIDCDDLYVCYLNINLQPYAGVTVHYEKNFNLFGIDFEFTDSYSVLADADGVKTAICAGQSIPFASCDLLISLYDGGGCESGTAVYFDLTGTQYNVYEHGDFEFRAKDGKLS